MSMNPKSQVVLGNDPTNKKKLKEAFEEYILVKMYADDLKERTIKEHKNNFRYFCDFLQHIGKKVTFVHQVDSDLCLQYWIFMKKEQGLVNATRRLRVRSLKAQFYFYFDKGYISSNPWIQDSIKLKDVDSPLRYLHEKEMHLIVNVLDTNNVKDFCTKALISTLLDTGLRISEALKVDEENVDFNRNLICVLKPKNDEIRYVPFSTKVAFLLKKLLKENAKIKDRTPALFINHNNGSRLKYDQVKESFYKIRKETGVLFSPHWFRHSFAVWFLVSGGDLGSLMQIGGWKTLAAVKVYLKVSNHLAIEQHKKHSPFNRLTD